jgi:hypothetical protein
MEAPRKRRFFQLGLFAADYLERDKQNTGVRFDIRTKSLLSGLRPDTGVAG